MPPVTRRDVLAFSSVSLLVPFTACLDGASTSDDGAGTQTPEKTRDGIETGSPGPDSYPDYATNAAKTIAYDDVDPATAAIYLEPSVRTVTPGDSITFTLANGRDVPLQINFYQWRLHKQVDGEWFHVAPHEWPEPLMTLPQGEEHTWTVTPTTDVTDSSMSNSVQGTDTLTVPGLGGGQYAFGTSGWFEGESHETQTAFVATFTFDADPLELTPTDAITETEWEGKTLVATSDRGDPDDEYSQLGAFILERFDDAPESARRLITEQVVRRPQLRDVLALAGKHDTKRVRLEEYTGTSPLFLVQGEQLVEYDGSFYRVTTSEVDT